MRLARGTAAMLLTMAAAGCGSARGEPAAGEIEFDHSLHAGRYEIPCQFCHAFADRAPVAGIPSVEKCMGCHKQVAADRPAIRALAAQYEKRRAPAFMRIHDLPDYVYFSHRMHVRAGVECAACHGRVESMKRVARVSSLDMGWCLDCHEERGASLDCLACHK